jgi:hypothetical protein
LGNLGLGSPGSLLNEILARFPLDGIPDDVTVNEIAVKIKFILERAKC